MPSTIVRYKDLPVRIFLSIAGALIFTVYGEPESTLELLLLPEFYPAFVISLIIASVVIHYVYVANTLLNRKYDWQTSTLQRALLQLLISLVVPALIAFAMAVAYFRYNGVDIRKTFYLTHEFPFIILLLALLNAYYICYYFLVKWQRTHQKLMSMENNAERTVIDRFGTFKVGQGAKTIALAYADLAYFYREDEANYLLTFTGERYFIPGTLDDVMQQLDNQFFRINRQLIINRKAMVSYKNIENGKMEVELKPAFPEQVVISQKRAKGFRDWVK